MKELRNDIREKSEKEHDGSFMDRLGCDEAVFLETARTSQTHSYSNCEGGQGEKQKVKDDGHRCAASEF